MEEKSWKYRVCFERAAGVGKTDGFKVEANGDNLEEVKLFAHNVYSWSISQAEANKPVPVIKEK